MDIRISKLLLQNFKGVKSLEINADGANLKIYGANATGKTTIFDAFMWLLFGKDSLGRSDFGIKTQDENGNTIHNLEHSVECELAIDNSVLTLKKVYAEKWTKKRGSAEAEFSGHETKYFVNEVPTTKKEYEQRISSIIDEDLFKTITNPLYFNEHLKWQDRRAILLNLCNNLSDEEIIAQSVEFSPLLEELKGRTVQEYKKIIQSKQSAINDNLKAIPQRIAEANLAIPEAVADVDETEKTVIEKHIADLNDDLNFIKNGSGATDAEIELRALKEQKRQLEISTCDTATLNDALFDAKIKLKNVEYDIDKCRRTISTINDSIADNELKADKLRKEWHEVNNKQYTDSGICPTCGQALPEEQIADAKVKFNTTRAEALESITEKGKQAKAEIERLQNCRLETASSLDRLLKSADEYKAECELLTTEIENAKAKFKEYKEKEIADLNLRIAEAAENALNRNEDVQTKIYTIEEQINAERAKIAEIDKAIAGRDLMLKQKERIAELEADEKRLAMEYSELDKIAFLIDKFTKYKVDLLSEEINSHFKYAKFKLFDEQINGGIAESCEVCYKGVPYSDLNNASRICIGIDIIETLSKYYDKHAVIITDNAESVNDIPETVSQQINLYVSRDTQLRIEKGV